MGSLVKTTPYSEVTATLEVLARHNITRKHLTMIRTNPRYAQKVEEAMLCCELEESSKRNKISVIMGGNSFSVDDWIVIYGAEFSKEQLSQVAAFPWGEDVLNAPCPFENGKSIKETHFAFLGLDDFNGEPLTLMKWHVLHSYVDKKPKFHYDIDPWYRKHEFAAKSTCQFHWYLMPLAGFPNRNGNSYKEHLRLAPPEYEPASAVEEVVKAFLYYRKTGSYLEYERQSWCKDKDNRGDRVLADSFGYTGFRLESHDENAWKSCGVSIALSRKLPDNIS
ncbi:MAG: hypothetical protein Q8R26_03400 [bacterium]|nr:hypothetical protein [bacterium]